MSAQRIPKGERSWCHYETKTGNYVVTSKDNDRAWFYMYKIESGKMQKLGRAHSPTELEETYNIWGKDTAAAKKTKRKQTAVKE